MADVVKGFGHADLELAVARHAKAFARADAVPLGFARQQILAATCYAFHHFGRCSAKGQFGRQNHPDRLFASIGQSQAVADAFALEVNAGLGGDGCALEVGGGHGR